MNRGYRLQAGDVVEIRGPAPIVRNQIGVEVPVSSVQGEVVFIDHGYNVALVCYRREDRAVPPDYVFLSISDLVPEDDEDEEARVYSNPEATV